MIKFKVKSMNLADDVRALHIIKSIGNFEEHNSTNVAFTISNDIEQLAKEIETALNALFREPHAHLS